MFDLEHSLDQLHSSVIHRRYLQLFTAFVRCLLALAFVPPSIPKILHKPFTMLPETDPVGAYFHALYNTGFYYEFLGWSQILAAVLLLIPRTAHLGALMFLPIIVNIAVLTSSVGFRGTWLITLLMSLAALWLTAWEYDRLKTVLLRTRVESTSRSSILIFSIPFLFAVAGGTMAAMMWTMRLGNLPNYASVGVTLTIVGFLFGLAVALHYRFMPVGRLKERRSEL